MKIEGILLVKLISRGIKYAKAAKKVKRKKKIVKFSPKIASKILPKLIKEKKLTTIFSKIGLAEANKGTITSKQSSAIVIDERV